MNKKGDAAAVIFVFITLILFGTTLYTFNISNKTIQTTISGQEELENVYFDADNFNFYLEESGERAFVDTYKYFIEDDKYIHNRIRQDNYPIFDEVKPNIDEDFKNEFSKKFNEELTKYGFEKENVEFFINGENQGIKVNKKFDKLDKEVSVSHNPEIIKEFSYNQLKLHSFNEILLAKNQCKKSTEKRKCYEEKLINFNVTIENKGNFDIIILTSKQEFLINNLNYNDMPEINSKTKKIQIIFRE